MKTTLIHLTSFAALTVAGLCQAKPPQVPADWKTECIGYFNISVPGEVDIALVPIQRNSRHRSPMFRQQQPMFSSLVHGGDFQVTDKVPYSFFTNKKNKNIKELDQLLIEQTHTSGNLKNYDNSRNDFFSDTFSNSEDTVISSYQWADGRMYLHSVTTVYNKFSEERLNAYVSEFSEQFRPRKLYEIPQEPGYCIPYGFVKSTMPQHPRKMSLSMILMDHPDVTIELREWGIRPGTTGLVSAEESIRAYWKATVGGRADKMQVLGFPRFPKVDMGGQKGRSVFVEITWPEKCGHEDIPYNPQVSMPPIVCKPPVIDYGYMAYITGEPSDKEDKPNLALLVMRKSQYGPDGQPTISKDELRKMAETIAASVRRR